MSVVNDSFNLRTWTLVAVLLVATHGQSVRAFGHTTQLSHPIELQMMTDTLPPPNSPLPPTPSSMKDEGGGGVVASGPIPKAVYFQPRY